jgi:PD-(D/E)XK nuclease superfamily protein
LIHELPKRGLQVESQVPIAVRYDAEILDVGDRVDLLVEGVVLVDPSRRYYYQSTKPSCSHICA